MSSVNKAFVSALLMLFPFIIAAASTLERSDDVIIDNSELVKRKEASNQETLDEYEAALYYHRKRTDPDSIIKAADALLSVSPEFSQSYAFATFSKAESYLRLYEKGAYLETTPMLKPEHYDTSLRPLVEFYLLVLEIRHNYNFDLNSEKAIILIGNAVLQARVFHPEMVPNLIATLSFPLGKLSVDPVLNKILLDYKKLAPSKTADEIDKINYKHGLALILYNMDNYQKAKQIEKDLIERIKEYPEDLTSLLADCYYHAGISSYKLEKSYKTLYLIEEAVKLKRRKEYLEMHIAILYHTKHYDRVIDECQRFLSEVIVGFHPEHQLSNPRIDGEILDGELPGNFMMWKARALYKKSFSQPDSEAIKMLLCGLESTKNGRILHNRLLFKLDGYKMAQLNHNDQNTYGLGYQMRIAYQLWLRTNKQQYQKMFFRCMEMRKAYLLSEAFSFSYLPEEEQFTLEKAIQGLEALEYRYLQSKNLDMTESFREILTEVRALDNCVQRIKSKYPREIMDHSQLSYADPDTIQAQLDDSTAYIIYTMQWCHHYVYVITSEGQQLIKLDKISRYDLDEKIAKLIKATSSPLQIQKYRRDKFINHSYGVYNFFFAPLEQYLKGIKKLIIIPEEYSGQIPFEVLVSNSEKKPYSDLDFLIKRFEISYHNSATLCNTIENDSRSANNSFLGFAPIFKKGTPISQQSHSSKELLSRFSDVLSGNAFAPLPGTEKEVKTIAKLLPDNIDKTLLLHEAATSDQLIEELKKGYKYAHLATHSIVNRVDPRRSAIACFNAEDQRGNFVFANNIEYLNLNVDLAVLSSCESGLGAILEGESIIALSRSFLAAGARNIIYSLWKVDDRYSSNLMISFYARHFQNRSYASSLRDAKLKMLRNPQTALPRLWAPFVLVGK